MPKVKKKIVAIGAGNLSHHFSAALSKKHELIQIFSRDIKHARKLNKVCKSKSISSLEKVDPTADIYLLMVPDHAIASVVKQLKLKITSPSQIIAHCSGATSSKVFRGTKCATGVFYGLQSFKKDEKIKLSKVPFLITASNPTAEKELFKMAKSISKNVQIADDEKRLKYHLAAVFVNNFVNHIFCKTDQWIHSQKLDKAVLEPIIEMTFEKIMNEDSCSIQTGPARRNDKSTIRKHMGLLKDNKDLKDIYREITESIKNHYL